ncbi:MAG: DNA polymerase I [Deltaproteobacteria bacterium]|nr:DNA polymerase I [Deltaproteobacteria bacterium]
MEKRLIIIDGNSVVYRAFHAIPLTLANSAGLTTNAVYGFTQTLRKVIADFGPDYIAVAFDVKGPTFRHEKFAEYKAQRPPMPELLSPQIPYIKKMLRAMNVAVLECRSFEADDVIATVVKRLEGSDIKIDVITGDKDMLQLVVDGKTVILDYIAAKELGVKEVFEKFGVGPERIRDLLALAGDQSDGIPGVAGIGLKTAAKLIKEFGSLEAIYENIDRVKGGKLRANLTAHRETAFLSRELATLHADAPFEWTIEGLQYRKPDIERLVPLLKELEFGKLLKEMGFETAPVEMKKTEFSVVDSEAGLGSVIDAARKSGRCALILLLTGEGPAAVPIGLAIAAAAGETFYIPVSGDQPLQGGLFGGVNTNAVDGFLKTIFEDAAVRKDSDNFKALYLYCISRKIGILNPGIDTSVASYLVNPSKSEHSIGQLAYEYLGEPEAGKEDLRDPEKAASLACKKAQDVIRVADILDKKLDEINLKKLYLEMELPLTAVLADMELGGIKVDAGILKDLSKEIESKLVDIEKEIYRAAGCEFNISSPKQLSQLLFERLKLKPVKKTKTGFSTDEEVLIKLAAGHEVPAMIISFRQLSKLKSTYVDAVAGLINPSTNRVHTSFNQTVTATGRLSSSRPNLQNIPVRGDYAGRIREAFIAEKGFFFFSADYSQIELRILAHMAQDPALIKAFLNDEDIHSATACDVFGVKDEKDVTPELRRRAKAINFGIVYGMGAYGLSTELGIPVAEAEEYISRYFAHYKKVREFIDGAIKDAAEKGYTETLFGRRRFIPELKSPVDATVRFGQRLAINTPIQGSAADIIKAAMINIFKRLGPAGARLRSKMILQIHDELVFEVALEEKTAIIDMVRREMEGVITLSVPIKVNVKSGLNWRDVE